MVDGYGDAQANAFEEFLGHMLAVVPLNYIGAILKVQDSLLSEPLSLGKTKLFHVKTIKESSDLWWSSVRKLAMSVSTS